MRIKEWKHYCSKPRTLSCVFSRGNIWSSEGRSNEQSSSGNKLECKVLKISYNLCDWSPPKICRWIFKNISFKSCRFGRIWKNWQDWSYWLDIERGIKYQSFLNHTWNVHKSSYWRSKAYSFLRFSTYPLFETIIRRKCKNCSDL